MPESRHVDRSVRGELGGVDEQLRAVPVRDPRELGDRPHLAGHVRGAGDREQVVAPGASFCSAHVEQPARGARERQQVASWRRHGSMFAWCSTGVESTRVPSGSDADEHIDRLGRVAHEHDVVARVRADERGDIAARRLVRLGRDLRRESSAAMHAAVEGHEGFDRLPDVRHHRGARRVVEIDVAARAAIHTGGLHVVAEQAREGLFHGPGRSRHAIVESLRAACGSMPTWLTACGATIWATARRRRSTPSGTRSRRCARAWPCSGSRGGSTLVLREEPDRRGDRRRLLPARPVPPARRPVARRPPGRARAVPGRRPRPAPGAARGRRRGPHRATRRAPGRARRRPAAGRPAAGRATARSPSIRWPTPRASAPAATSSTPTSPRGAIRAPRSGSPTTRCDAVACDGRRSRRRRRADARRAGRGDARASAATAR